MLFSELPEDALCTILSKLDRPKDRLNASLTCRLLWDVNKRQLYSSIRTTNSYYPLTLIKLILKDPAVVPYVQRMTIARLDEHSIRLDDQVSEASCGVTYPRTLYKCNAIGQGPEDLSINAIRNWLSDPSTYLGSEEAMLHVLLSISPNLKHLAVTKLGFAALWLEKRNNPGGESRASRLAYSKSIHIKAASGALLERQNLVACLDLPSLKQLHLTDLIMVPQDSTERLPTLVRGPANANLEELHLERTNMSAEELEDLLQHLSGCLRRFTMKWTMRTADREARHLLSTLNLFELKTSLYHVRSTLQHFELRYDFPIKMDTEVVGALGSLSHLKKLTSLHLDKFTAVDLTVERLTEDDDDDDGDDDDQEDESNRSAADIFPHQLEELRLCDCGAWIMDHEDGYPSDGSMFEEAESSDEWSDDDSEADMGDRPTTQERPPNSRNSDDNDDIGGSDSDDSIDSQISSTADIEAQSEGPKDLFSFSSYLEKLLEAKQRSKLPSLRTLSINDLGLAWEGDFDDPHAQTLLYPLGRRHHPRRGVHTLDKTALREGYALAKANDVSLQYAPLRPRIEERNLEQLGRGVIDRDPFGLDEA